jgi:hypothetical protein
LSLVTSPALKKRVNVGTEGRTLGTQNLGSYVTGTKF